jgi:uncharacterized membrane protein YdjX (TVP38/TMEM64 family)
VWLPATSGPNNFAILVGENRFSEAGIRLLAKFKRMDQFTAQMERNAFFSVLIARLIPFVPAVFVNVYTAISRMRFGTFMAATFIGKIPVMFVLPLLAINCFPTSAMCCGHH